MATKKDFVIKNGLVVTEDIQLGHASDTTIARASAGQITVAGTAVVLAGSASHDGFSDFVADEHIDHTSVTLTAGTGLTGGGDISTNRTFALDIDGISSALSSGLASTDELVISDAGTVKKMDVSVLQSYMQSNLTFATNTDVDVNVSNLTARLPQITESVTIGDATDVTVTTSGDLTVTGDLNVSEVVDPTGTGNLKLRAGSSFVNILDGGVSNHINISPASGRLNLFAETIAMGDADVTMTTRGAYDLTLSTNNGTNSGTIVIADGANGNISLTPNGTGNVALGNFTFNADQTVGSGQDNYVLTYDNSAGTISLEAASSGGIASVAADSTPQLGGDLDVNGNKITSASNADVTIEPNGTGDINLYADTLVVGDSSADFTIQHRTTTNSILRFQAGGNTQLTSDGPIFLNADEAGDGGSDSKIRLNAITSAFGKANTNAVLTTQGTGDMTLSTNSGTNSGTIVIADGANANISLTPNGTGNVSIGNFTFDADQTVGSGQDNYVLTYDNSAGTISLEEASGGSPGGSDTQIMFNDGGSFGGDADFTFTKTDGAEQVKIEATSTEALLKLVQKGTGTVFEVHDSASDTTIFSISDTGSTLIGLAPQNIGADKFYVQGRISGQRYTVYTDGSASAPVFTRYSDLNTGMYFDGADVLKFATGGTERVKLSSSGLQLGAANAEVTTILNETDMASDSATALATQQSIKAYVDNNAGGGVSLSGSTNDQLVTVTGSNAIKGESNLTLSSAGALALTGTMTMTDTASDNTTPVLTVEQNRADDNAMLAKFIANNNEVLHIRNNGRLHWELSTSGGASEETIMSYNDTNGDERNFMMIEQGTIVINNRGPNGDVEIRANTSSIGSGGEVSVANFQDDRVILNTNVGIGTTSPQANLHISSGTSGDAVLILEADTDNNDEADQPFIVFEQDGGTQHSAIGSHSGGNTDNNALIFSNSVASSGVEAGMIFKTGETAGYANATESMRIYPSGETQARKTRIKAVSSNTTLGDDDSGKTIYWTGGTLTLPATAESGQQFVIINNTNGSATPSLGTSNSIATNWTAHAAMSDETARTYIAVAANTWIYIG